MLLPCVRLGGCQTASSISQHQDGRDAVALRQLGVRALASSAAVIEARETRAAAVSVAEQNGIWNQRQFTVRARVGRRKPPGRAR